MKYYEDKFPKTAVNTYPLGIQAVAITSMILAGIYMDKTKRCLEVGILCGVLQFTSAAMLVAPSLSTAGTFFAFYLSGSSFMVNPLLYGWGGIIARRGGDNAARAIILYVMNTGGQLLYTWWGIVLYPATDAPYWKKGAIAVMVAVVCYSGGLYCMCWVSNISHISFRICRDCFFLDADADDSICPQLDKRTKETEQLGKTEEPTTTRHGETDEEESEDAEKYIQVSEPISPKH